MLSSRVKNQPKMAASSPIVEFNDAAVTRSGRLIWSEGNFSIPRGSVTAIVGTNGAGKTTLLSIELGLLPLSRGTVRILGQTAGSVNDRIGYVPQSYASDIDSNITAEQSVALGLTGAHFGFHRLSAHDKEKIRSALKMSGIADKASLRLSQMSGGMRQRVAIAQALVSDPELLLLDEPLANLDLAGQRGLVDVLSKLNTEFGMSIQVVAHDINMLLPILTGAVYLLDGHPHYSPISNVMDSTLLTHLYGTKVEVIKTPQGDMFVRPDQEEEPVGRHPHTHTTTEVAAFHTQTEHSEATTPTETTRSTQQHTDKHVDATHHLSENGGTR